MYCKKYHGNLLKMLNVLWQKGWILLFLKLTTLFKSCIQIINIANAWVFLCFVLRSKVFSGAVACEKQYSFSIGLLFVSLSCSSSDIFNTQEHAGVCVGACPWMWCIKFSWVGGVDFWVHSVRYDWFCSIEKRQCCIQCHWGFMQTVTVKRIKS